MLESLRKREELLKKFKGSWYDEYQFSLRETCTEFLKIDYLNKIHVDEVILMKNPAKPRPFSQLGRFVELYLRGDEIICSVGIRKRDGSEELNSIKHLYPMELSLTHSQDTMDPPTKALQYQRNTHLRPKR